MTTMTLVPSGLPTIHDATLPVSYERAKAALATCVEIDECKDWADKAAALASYAKQAEDQTLHHFATRISARAIKRAGELLEQFDARGAHRKNGSAPVSSRIDAGKRAGMSPDQITQAVRVANVPVDEFEALVESEHPPTVTALAELGTAKQAERPVVPGVREATHIIGVLFELARDLPACAPPVVAAAILPHEIPKLRTHTAVVQEWLTGLMQALKEDRC